jgi:hypothetical protein
MTRPERAGAADPARPNRPAEVPPAPPRHRAVFACFTHRLGALMRRLDLDATA